MVVALVGAFFGGFGGFFGCGEREGGVLGGVGSVGGWGSRKQAFAPRAGAVTCTAGVVGARGLGSVGGVGVGGAQRGLWKRLTAAYTDRIQLPHT